MPLVIALRGKGGRISEFQDSQNYAEKPCVENPKENPTKTLTEICPPLCPKQVQGLKA